MRANDAFTFDKSFAIVDFFDIMIAIYHKQNMLEKILVDNWLTLKQAQIYIASLELWPAPVARIAWKSGVNRTSCYDIIQEMTAKWIIIKSQRQWVDHYHVIQPEILIAQQQQKISLLQQSLLLFSQLINWLTSKPRFSLYEWVEGVKNWYADLLTSNTKIMSFVGSMILDESVDYYIRHTFSRHRIEQKIEQIILSTWSAYHKIIPEEYCERIQINKPELQIGCGIHLYGPNKVMCTMLDQDEMFLFIIHSQQLYDTLASIFITLTWIDKLN